MKEVIFISQLKSKFSIFESPHKKIPMNPIQILLVEDNEGDIYLTKEALAEGKISKEVQVVKDGWEAILYLDKKGKYNGVITPNLILLDINLPKLNGFEVLDKIKHSNHTEHIPVIMLSTSSSERDINKCYNKRANCFISKPVDADDFFRVIQSIEEFWLSQVQLPINN